MANDHAQPDAHEVDVHGTLSPDQGTDHAQDAHLSVPDQVKGVEEHAVSIMGTAKDVHALEGETGHHGGEHHGLELGRHITHPPEPPHFIQVWYQMEQEQLKKDYAAAHGMKPEDISSIELWLKKTGEHEWEEVPGESPTVAQVLHYGTLKHELPLIGYAPWENHVFFGIAALVLVLFMAWLTAPFRSARKSMMRRPNRRQMVVEMIVGGFDDFCKGVLGEHNGRKYMPFIGTLFLLILFCNLMGLIPLMKAPSSSIVITLSLALCTFIMVQGTAWTKLGPASYIHHLMGSPKDAIGWFMSPLFLVLEVISDFVAKPASLALRLFGNILGKDILLGAFLGMGIALVSLIFEPLGDIIGLPLTIPFYFLGLLLSTIQALVFALLSAIYITMVLPHDHDHEHDHDHGAHVGQPIENVPAQPLVHERLPS